MNRKNDYSVNVFVKIVALIFVFWMFLSHTDQSCNIIKKCAGCFESYDIKRAFLKCRGNYNKWQKDCRKKWKLKYIAWSKVEDFLPCRTDAYYGCWLGRNGFKEIYHYKKTSKELSNFCHDFSMNPVNCAFKKKKKADEKAPYEISANLSLEEQLYLDFEFTNHSDSIAKEITIVCFIFDEDGNSPLQGKSSLVVHTDCYAEPENCFRGRVGLEKFFDFNADAIYEVDFVYISRILFEDGSEWMDPYGLRYFGSVPI